MCVSKWKLVLFFVLASFILGCQEEDNESGLVTLDPVVIDNSTVQLHGKFTGSPVAGEELGFVWDGLTNPEYARSRVTVSATSSGNDLYGELTNLDFGKIYYVRTYRKNGSAIHYGHEKSFTFGGLVPEIAHLVPASAHLGDTVVIVGKNFSPDMQRLALQFGSLLSTIISASGDTVRCIVPHHLAAGPHPVSIKVGSNLSNSVSFNLHHPSVLNFSPTSATFLDVIEIHGSNFHKNKSSNTVRFGSVKAEIIATESEMLTVRVPLGITETSAPISVQVDSQRVESTEPFFLLPSTISGIYPSEGGVSTIIKINGANFNPWKDNNEVLFGKNRASVIEASATQLSVVVPTGIYDNRTVAVTVKTATQSNQASFDLTDVWIRKTDIPAGRFGRYEAQGFALNGIGFAGLGGGAGVASAYQDFYRFDSEENLWSRVADYGGGKRYGTASFVIDDYAFVGTGSVTTAGEGTNDFYKYDKQNNSWTRVADFPGIPTTNAIGFEANGKGYLCLPNIADNFWEYDPGVNVWTQKTTIVASALGGEKKVVAAFVLQNRAFVVVSQYSQAELYEYDLAGDQWLRKNDIYGVWNKPIIVSNNSHAYHHGDHGITRYNIADDSWEAISTERVPAGNDAFSFSIGDKIYLGSGNNDYKSMWECDTSKL